MRRHHFTVIRPRLLHVFPFFAFIAITAAGVLRPFAIQRYSTKPHYASKTLIFQFPDQVPQNNEAVQEDEFREEGIESRSLLLGILVGTDDPIPRSGDRTANDLKVDPVTPFVLRKFEDNAEPFPKHLLNFLGKLGIPLRRRKRSPKPEDGDNQKSTDGDGSREIIKPLIKEKKQSNGKGRAVSTDYVDYYDTAAGLSPSSSDDTAAAEPAAPKPPKPTDGSSNEPHKIQYIYGENSYMETQGHQNPIGIDDAQEVNDAKIRDAAEASRKEAFQAAYEDTAGKEKAVAMAQGKDGLVDANAVSMIGQDAVATSTNGSEANALAASKGGDGQAIASSQGYGEKGAKSAALNLGKGTASGSAIAQGEMADARSDAVAQYNNASSSSLAEKGGDSKSNALTQVEGHASSNAAALEGGEAVSSAVALGKGNSKSGSWAEGGGNSTALSKAYDGNSTAASRAKDKGSAYSASWSKHGGNSKASSFAVGGGNSRAESKNDGSGASLASAFHQKEGEEEDKFNAAETTDSLGGNSGANEFGIAFFNRGIEPSPVTKTKRPRNDLAQKQ